MTPRVETVPTGNDGSALILPLVAAAAVGLVVFGVVALLAVRRRSLA